MGIPGGGESVWQVGRASGSSMQRVYDRVRVKKVCESTWQEVGVQTLGGYGVALERLHGAEVHRAAEA